MSNQEYIIKFMHLYFVIIPFIFSVGLMINVVFEIYKEYKKRKKLKEILSKETLFDENH